MLGEVIQPVQPFDYLIKVSPPVLNHIIRQRQVKNIIIMSINTHLIDHEIKLMKMGGREKILLERETISLIIPPKSVATRLINSSMKGATICRRRLISIHAKGLTACQRLRGNEISEEYCMVSWRRR
jgi:hypothetical protein